MTAAANSLTEDEIRELPAKSVVLDGNGFAWQADHNLRGYWWSAGTGVLVSFREYKGAPPALLERQPITLIHRGE